MQITIETQTLIVSRPMPVASATSAPEGEPIVGPAVVGTLHVQDRLLDKRPGAPVAWRKLSHLDAAFKAGRLGPVDSAEAFRRKTAGQKYTLIWDTAQSPGRDSTQQMDSAGGGTGMPISMVQREAFQTLASLECALSPNDRTIIRAVCGTGHSPAEAMKLARLHCDTRVSARLCEALDSLASVIEKKFRK